MEISAHRLFPSGAWEISTIYDGQLISVAYFGYTKREAIREFKADLKERTTR